MTRDDPGCRCASVPADGEDSIGDVYLDRPRASTASSAIAAARASATSTDDPKQGMAVLERPLTDAGPGLAPDPSDFVDDEVDLARPAVPGLRRAADRRGRLPGAPLFREIELRLRSAVPVVDDTSHWVPDPNEQPAAAATSRSADLLDEAAAQWPDREAIVYSAYDDLGIAARWSFEELRERARATSRAR